MSKKGKISNNYSVEPLEPRFMLSATAEDAAVDWINQQLITEITTSINLSESESVKHNGSNLSINDLISGSFALTSSDVQLTKQGNTDYYDVLLSDDIIINPQKSFEIQQSAPLSAADIQALLSIDPDNLGGSGNIKV